MDNRNNDNGMRIVSKSERLLMIKEELSEAIPQLRMIFSNLDFFPERYQSIFFTRYGLDADLKVKTLVSVGKKYNISSERVRMIISRTWRILREKTRLWEISEGWLIKKIKQTFNE